MDIKANLNSKGDRWNMCVGLLHIGVLPSLLNIATVWSDHIPEHGTAWKLNCLSIHPSVHPSIRPSVHPSIQLFIYGSTVLLLDLGRYFNLLILHSLLGLLGGEISPFQGHYLHKEQHKHRINAHRQPFLEWDSNPRSQRSSERRQFMP
jgi:hypothetical protein